MCFTQGEGLILGKSKFLCLSITIGLVLLFACKSMNGPSNVFTVENGVIPPEFGKTNTTLLCVMRGYKPYDTMLKRYVKGKFKGNYQFVMPSKLSESPYDDPQKFRFVFNHKVSHERELLYDPLSEARHRIKCTKYHFYVLDRKTGIKYKSPMEGSSFGKLIHIYIMALQKKWENEEQKRG